MKFKIKSFFDRRKNIVSKKPGGLSIKKDDDGPITNDTIAIRREEVLGKARKYIYPLQASKHRVVRFSIAVLVVAIVGFFTFCILELYQFQVTSGFMFDVTQVIPFPVAIIDNSDFVTYNSYLFQLRHYMHYYETQQNVNFSTAKGQQQLSVFKQQSLNQALQNAYVKQLAKNNNISVSQNDINNAVSLVRTENRLGANNQVFQEVLSEFWGWTVSDFKRELSDELLAQKVVSRLDSQTHVLANQALSALQKGANFATLAQQDSQDKSTSSNGGNYGIWIDQSNTDIAPQIVNALFQLKLNQYSGIINTGYSLEIVKVLAIQGNEVQAAHISFNFNPISTYTAPLESSEKPHLFIHV